MLHNVSVAYEGADHPPSLSNPPDQKPVSALADLLEGCFVETCSTVYRRRVLVSFPPWYASDMSADWSLAVISAHSGTVDYLDEVMAVYRKHAGAVWRVAFDIQLDLPHIPIAVDRRYIVAFRARADASPKISVGVAHAGAPWSGLGYYRPLDLDERWCAVRDNFVAVESTPNARIHFDLGGHTAAGEIAAVSIEEQT